MFTLEGKAGPLSRRRQPQSVCASKDFLLLPSPPSFDTVEGHIIPLTLQWLFSAFYRAILFDSPAAAAAQAVETLKRKYKMSLNWTKKGNWRFLTYSECYLCHIKDEPIISILNKL